MFCSLRSNNWKPRKRQRHAAIARRDPSFISFFRRERWQTYTWYRADPSTVHVHCSKLTSNVICAQRREVFGSELRVNIFFSLLCFYSFLLTTIDQLWLVVGGPLIFGLEGAWKTNGRLMYEKDMAVTWCFIPIRSFLLLR